MADVEAFKALASELEVELGLHRVDRSRGRTQTRGAAREYECIRGVQSFARWAEAGDWASGGSERDCFMGSTS